MRERAANLGRGIIISAPMYAGAAALVNIPAGSRSKYAEIKTRRPNRDRERERERESELRINC